METYVGIFIVCLIILSPFLLFEGFTKYANYMQQEARDKVFNSPTYIAYKQQHDKNEKENRLANKLYTYDEKYVDYTYENFNLFDRENLYFNHHNMPAFYVGAFEGTAECAPNDAKNGTYMASIYDGQHIFINKIEIPQRLFDYIIHCGGSVRAYGNIQEYGENYIMNHVYVVNRWWGKNEPKLRIYHGEVYIESGSKFESLAETNPIGDKAKIAMAM